MNRRKVISKDPRRIIAARRGSRRLLYLLLIISVSLTASAETTTDRKKRGYKGPVKSAVTKVVRFSTSGGIRKRETLVLDSSEEFDKLGRLVINAAYYFDGRLMLKDKHSYDSFGRLIETSTRDSQFIDMPERTTYKYNGKGRLIEEDGLDLEGRLLNRGRYSYDERDRRTAWSYTSYDPKRETKPSQWTYSYDQRGRLSEERIFIDEGAGFVPDESFAESSHRMLHLYDELADPSTMLFFKASGELTQAIVFEYDRRGNTVKQLEYAGTGEMLGKTVFSYRYDRYGNWVRQYEYRWSKGSVQADCQIEKIGYRSIEYYAVSSGRAFR